MLRWETKTCSVFQRAAARCKAVFRHGNNSSLSSSPKVPAFNCTEQVGGNGFSRYREMHYKMQLSGHSFYVNKSGTVE